MHQLVVHDMVDQPHVEQELTPRVIEVLVGREIVADVVPRLPPSKEGEPEREREGEGEGGEREEREKIFRPLQRIKEYRLPVLF